MERLVKLIQKGNPQLNDAKDVGCSQSSVSLKI